MFGGTSVLRCSLCSFVIAPWLLLLFLLTINIESHGWPMAKSATQERAADMLRFLIFTTNCQMSSVGRYSLLLKNDYL